MVVGPSERDARLQPVVPAVDEEEERERLLNNNSVASANNNMLNAVYGEEYDDVREKIKHHFVYFSMFSFQEKAKLSRTHLEFDF